MSFDVLFNQFMSGIARAALLFLVASGLSLTFGVLRVLNFAHGSIYMLGAFITYSIWKYLLIPVVGFYIATIIASLIMAGIGIIIEFFLLRRLYSRGWPEQLLATYAIILIITDLVKWGWGGEFLSIPRPKPFTGAVFLFGFPFPSYNFFIILLVWLLSSSSGGWSIERVSGTSSGQPQATGRWCPLWESPSHGCSHGYSSWGP